MQKSNQHYKAIINQLKINKYKKFEKIYILSVVKKKKLHFISETLPLLYKEGTCGRHLAQITQPLTLTYSKSH